MKIREATVGDAAAIKAIYAPFVSDTAISFEEVPPDTVEMAKRISSISQNYPYLVAEEAGKVIGYAYASQHRTRAAYRSSVDVAAYVQASAHGRGAGRALYQVLLPAASASGYHAAFAGIAIPNDASVGFHDLLEFTPVGIYREVGRKFGSWHDVGWWQRLL